MSAALTLVLMSAVFARADHIQAPIFSPCDAPSRELAGSESIRVDGFARSYLVHVPEHKRVQRLPIVFAFHGRGETPEQVERYSELSGFLAIVVYPRGLPGRGGKLSWSGTPAAAQGVDDVHFVRAIFARLQAWSCVDAARVYATGKSDGGSLAGQLACKAADVITAAAPVAGAYYPIAGGCAPSRPVAILEFHGTNDRVIPYKGARKRKLPDVYAWLVAWANRNGCTQEPRSSIVALDASRQVWTGCRHGADVEGYRIDGGGHTWPGARLHSGAGMTAQDINASAIIATFFGLPYPR